MVNLRVYRDPFASESLHRITVDVLADVNARTIEFVAAPDQLAAAVEATRRHILHTVKNKLEKVEDDIDVDLSNLRIAV